MFIKIMIIVAILAGIIILPLITSLLFNQEAEFKIHSCGLDDGGTPGDDACSSCQIKDLASCDYNEQQLQKS
jgi:hypothetical protein